MTLRGTIYRGMLAAAVLLLLVGLWAMLKSRRDADPAGDLAGTPTPGAQASPSIVEAEARATPTSTEIVVASSQPASSPVCGWSNVSNPVSGTLKGIKALSPSSIWAVGSRIEAPTATLIEHWDGTSWNVMPSPNVEGKHNSLNALSAISESDIWAVGYSGSGDTSLEGRKALILHWDGTTWEIVLAPATLPGAEELTAIAAVSAGDAWAVGHQIDCASGSCKTQTLAIYWDGNAWAQAPSPDPSDTNNVLLGIAAVTSEDVWAVGNYEAQLPGSMYLTGRALTMHWDGHSWKVVPNTDAAGASLSSLAALAGDDVWAVGGISGEDAESSCSLYLHWDGKAWSRFPTGPDCAGNGVNLAAVAALSHDNVWAVGGWPGRLVSHWDGKAWSYYPYSMIDGDYVSTLFSITAISPGEIYAVGGPAGFSGPGYVPETVIMRYADGACSTRTPTPTSTSTVTVTDTPTITPTETATATRTPLSPAHFSADPAITTQCGTWHPFSSADLTVGSSSINAVSVVPNSADPAKDIWAVGEYSVGAGSEIQPLILHWDGSAWTHYLSPKVMVTVNFAAPPLTTETEHASLSAVSAVSVDDVWAVGSYDGHWEGQEKLALIMHWDGSVWKVVASPALDPGLKSNLVGVAAIASDDVWAVGYTFRDDTSGSLSTEKALAIHWDGKGWGVVPLPPVGDGAILASVAAASSSDVWAIGSYFGGSAEGDAGTPTTVSVPSPVDTSQPGMAGGNATRPPPPSHSLSLHWNGKAWSQVAVGDDKVTLRQSGLLDVAVLSSGEAWALGFEMLSYDSAESKVWHWNGTSWSAIPGPLFQAYRAGLAKLSVLSPNDIWAVGSYAEKSGDPAHILMAHWDGGGWTILAGPTDRTWSQFGGVAATSHDGVWVTGSARAPNSDFNTAYLWRFDGSQCSTPATKP